VRRHSHQRKKRLEVVDDRGSHCQRERERQRYRFGEERRWAEGRLLFWAERVPEAFIYIFSFLFFFFFSIFLFLL
jgi:hypothetical protein